MEKSRPNTGLFYYGAKPHFEKLNQQNMELLNELPNPMNTLCDVMNKLEQRGMANDFRWEPRGFTLDGQNYYSPEELTITKVYRFEELKDPSDLCVLYLVQAHDHTTGYILDTYGASSNHDGDFNNALRRIPEAMHPDQLHFQL